MSNYALHGSGERGRQANPKGNLGVAASTVENRDSMSSRELVAWAWRETPPVHRNGTNLIIHLFAVPLFGVGHLLLLAAVFSPWWLAGLGLLCVVVSLALQGVGHSLERQKVPPFTGGRDFVRRLYAEQFCNFWRFLFSGQWYASFNAASHVSIDRPGR
jgi:hypothetical protein